MNDDKIRGAQIKTDSRFARWFENYWYHYKWTTIIVGFFLIVALVCGLQMCTREEQDISIIYAGPQVLNAEMSSEIEGVMDFVMFSNDEEKSSAVVSYLIYSEAQIKEIEAQTYANGESGFVDKPYNATNYDNFYSYLQTGESSICFLDPSLFESLRDAGRLASISDTVGYLPDGAIDEYGVSLRELGIYSAYGSMRKLPEDTVVCILLPLVAGKSSDEEIYAYEQEMFATILEFSNEN